MIPQKRPELEHRDLLKLFPRILAKLYTLWVMRTYPFYSLGKKVSFHPTCDLGNTALMQIGDFLTVHKDVWLHAHPGGANESVPVLAIGNRCFIGRRSHISAKNSICIEDDVMFAASVLVQDHGHDFSDVTRPIGEQGSNKGGVIRIGQGSWIGQGAAIICDSGELILGRNCVVGANAVVTRSAPPFSVLSGNPARIVKQFDSVRGVWVLGASRQSEGEVARQPSAEPAGVRSYKPTHGVGRKIRI